MTWIVISKAKGGNTPFSVASATPYLGFATEEQAKKAAGVKASIFTDYYWFVAQITAEAEVNIPPPQVPKVTWKEFGNKNKKKDRACAATAATTSSSPLKL